VIGNSVSDRVSPMKHTARSLCRDDEDGDEYVFLPKIHTDGYTSVFVFVGLGFVYGA
jgi:hypothetical protein